MKEGHGHHVVLASLNGALVVKTVRSVRIDRVLSVLNERRATSTFRFEPTLAVVMFQIVSVFLYDNMYCFSVLCNAVSIIFQFSYDLKNGVDLADADSTEPMVGYVK